jgi:myo-inositol-1(or 4)-monophosphatase
VISEESQYHSFDINKLQWIIDPIDGTLNFHRGFPMAATSIALWENGAPILGVVHHLFDDQVFYSYKDYGAWSNNNIIGVSTTEEISDAILVTGFPSGSNHDTNTLNQFINNAQNYKKLRMLGSAALMLGYVACGIFDVYSEKDIYIWDVAAGLAVVSEAGGSYVIQPGTSMFKYNVKASNNCLIKKAQC